MYLTTPVGEVRALPSDPPSQRYHFFGERSVWWRSVRDIQCFTIARLLKNQPWGSGGGFAQGSCQSAFTYLFPNLWTCVRAAIHSSSHRIWISVTGLQPAEITHLKHCALPAALLSTRWQGWVGPVLSRRADSYSGLPSAQMERTLFLPCVPMAGNTLTSLRTDQAELLS